MRKQTPSLPITSFIKDSHLISLTEMPLVYHATRNSNVKSGELDPSYAELGIHAGSKKQAYNISRKDENLEKPIDSNPWNLHTLYTDYKNKVRLIDPGTWEPMAVLHDLIIRKDLNITVEDFERAILEYIENNSDYYFDFTGKPITLKQAIHGMFDILKRGDIEGRYIHSNLYQYLKYNADGKTIPDTNVWEQLIRTILLNKGYDGIVYLNRYEGVKDVSPDVKVPHGLYSGPDEAFKKVFPDAHDSFILFKPYGAMKNILPVKKFRPHDPFKHHIMPIDLSDIE